MFSVSSDPEFFLTDKKAGHAVISCGKFGGTKKNPKRISNGFIQEDNVALELNPFPSSTFGSFVYNHVTLLEEVKGILDTMGLELSPLAFIKFSEAELFHPLSWTAGCEPDYSAWENGEVNSPPNFFLTHDRCAGGHVHIAWDSFEDTFQTDVEFNKRIDFIKVLDLSLGVPSVLMDEDSSRRALYGKAGAFRPKAVGNKDKYNGVEYRTLSNFWMFKREFIEWVYKAVEDSIENNEKYISILKKEGENVRKIIDNFDSENALHLCRKYDLLVA